MLRKTAQQLYNRVQSWIPRRVAVYNGVAVKRLPIYDTDDIHIENEVEWLDAIRDAVKPGDSVAVVGGGFGCSTVAAARKAGRGGSVTTYEASRNFYELCSETAEINAVGDRVDVRHALVGPAVDVWENEATASRNRMRAPPGELPEYDVLVLDCEGAEEEILENYPHNPREVIVETHGFLGVAGEDITDLLSERGYEVVDRLTEDADREVYIFRCRLVDERDGGEKELETETA